MSSSAPAFVLKLWKLVEDQNVDDLISWSKEGTAFCVHDPVAFAREVLPYYFKHNNFTSFVRQLNMYGFKKLVSTDHGGIKMENPEWEFYHQYFLQSRSELLENIKRKVHPEEKKIKNEDVSNILEDVKQLHARHGAVHSQLESIKLENEMLWQEISDLRIKHRKQQHVLNKLIRFLILMYGRKGVTSQKRLAIQPAEISAKHPRMSPPHGQIEELENLRYVVESPKATSNVRFQMESEDNNSGPQITLLPDEPSVQNSDSVAPLRSSATASVAPQTVSASKTVSVVPRLPTAQLISSNKNPQRTAAEVSTVSASSVDPQEQSTEKFKKSNSKGAAKTPSKRSESSLKLKMPTMVSIAKEPVLDFSPSIFESIGQLFPGDSNVSNIVIDDTLTELQTSYDQPNAVVLRRETSRDKDFIDHDVDHISNSLDSLQSILAGGQYNLGSELLSQLFNPDDDNLPIDAKSLPGNIMVQDLQKQTDKGSTYEASNKTDDTDDLEPFSPGMFLNDVGEPSTDSATNEVDLGESSLLQ